MLAQIFIMAPLWDATLSHILLQVIWAIGLCMVFLSVLQFLPYKVLLVVGLIIVFSHNLLDSITFEAPFWKSFTWAVLHQEHEFQINNHLLVIIAYPFLPWLGLMILGYCIGKLYLPETNAKARKKTFANCRNCRHFFVHLDKGYKYVWRFASVATSNIITIYFF